MFRKEKNIVKLENAIKKHINENSELKIQVSLLTTIPGVALITAATIIGELGDIHRFSSAKKVAAFVGVSPRKYESGKSVIGAVMRKMICIVRRLIIDKSFYEDKLVT
jgi:transposase